jgi:hypothetical protein
VAAETIPLFAENFGKNVGVFCSNYLLLVFAKNDNIGFREKRHFFCENWQKSQKIVITSSTPGPSNSTIFLRQRLQVQAVKIKLA